MIQRHPTRHLVDKLLIATYLILGYRFRGSGECLSTDPKHTPQEGVFRQIDAIHTPPGNAFPTSTLWYPNSASKGRCIP